MKEAGIIPIRPGNRCKAASAGQQGESQERVGAFIQENVK
jgi:hypothetical protein